MTLINFTYKNDFKDIVFQADKNLLFLSRQKVTEETILKELKKYNLLDALITIANTYRFMLKKSKQDKTFRVFMCEVENSKYHLRVDSLAKLIHLIIKSGANIYTEKNISDNALPNMLLLCNLIPNTINISVNEQSVLNCLCIMETEQINLQRHPKYLAGINYSLFSNNSFEEKFKKRIGINLKQYYNSCLFLMLFFNRNNILFEIDDILKILPEKENPNITTDNIIKIIDYLAIDIDEYRKRINSISPNLLPLQDKPILKFNLYGKTKYIVPSPPYFLEKSYDGIFYDIEKTYENRNDFTQELGYVFENYVGHILELYSENIKILSEKEVSYTKNSTKASFVDWVVIENKEIYLIEVKSVRMSLKDIYNYSIKDFVYKHIIPAYKQLIRKILDIEKYPELFFLKNTQLSPIIIFRKIPFLNSPVFISHIETCIKDYIKENPKDYFIKEYLDKNNVFLFNIDDFELYWANRQITSLKELFQNISIQDSIKSYLLKLSDKLEEHKIYNETYNLIFKETRDSIFEK